MNDMKEMFSTPIIYLYDASRNLIAVFNTQDNYKTVYDVTLKETMNEVSELTFKILFDNDKISYNSCEYMVKVNGLNTWFIIKSIEVTDDDTNVIQVTAESEEVSLKGVLCTGIDVIARTPEQMWNDIKSAVTSCTLDRYVWGGTDIDSNIKRALQVQDEQSVFENMLAMAKVFDGWFEFNQQIDGTIQLFLRTKAIDNGKYIMKGKDLKQLNITYDSKDIVTQLFAFGSTDKDGVELNIMQVNPTGKSYLENYDYFLSLGMTIDEIKNEPRCLQQKIYRDDVFVNDTDLFNQAVIELNKVCVPKLTGTISMLDFGVMKDTSITSPVIGENVEVINVDTKYVMSARIDSITRKFTENPLDIDVTISNLISYTSVFRNLVITSTTLDRITSTDSEGKPYVPPSVIKDPETGKDIQSEWDWKMGDLEGKITANAEELKTEWTNWATHESSTIEQTAQAITLCVKNDEFGTKMIENAESFNFLFNNFSTYIKMDATGIIAGDSAAGAGLTKLTSTGIVHIDDATGTNPVSYHYWTQVGTVSFSNALDISPANVILDSHFKGTQVQGIASINKAVCNGNTALNWLASYVSEVNTNTLTATISGQANYRDIASGEQIGGSLIVNYMFVG
jgi:phage minor structural protein